MCGILGVISSLNLNNDSDVNWVENGLNILEHRGPDGKGLLCSNDQKILFGHRRLSIIDLTPLGSQPMYRKDLGLLITFNGEIYNYLEIRNILISKGYHFNSNSDTEVLLVAYAHWGSDFLSNINGMFAFALYDEKKKICIIARDRVGEKPLYYFKSSNKFYFSSEIKGLIINEKIERKINTIGLNYYLSLGYIPSPESIIKDIYKLKPGHFLEINTNIFEVTEKKYWDLPKINFCKSQEELVLELDGLLKKSVERQLISDVPLGILLSGGVDSSIITAYASESSSKVNTFNIRFPGHGNLDETKHARVVSDHFDTNHIELDANDIIDLDFIENICKDFDEPVNDSSLVPTFLVSKLVKEHCTVALGGDGGDEMFGGYSKYLELLKYKSLFNFIPFGTRKFLYDTAISNMPIGMKGRNWLQYFSFDYFNNRFLIENHFDATSQKKLLKNSLHNDFKFDIIYNQMLSERNDLIRNATELDFRTYLPEDILVKIDRASMLNSLEVRAPFLDFEIIEFAFKYVPSDLKVHNGDKKILLKALCKRKLPLQFDFNRKQGFSMPLFELLKDKKWQSYIQEVLCESGLDIFDKKYISNLVSSINSGRMNSERIFGLLFLCIWANKHKLSL